MTSRSQELLATDVLTEPKTRDIEMTSELIATLRQHNVFDNKEEEEKRNEIVLKIEGLFKTWITGFGKPKTSIPGSAFNRCDAKVMTFGSYRLGVHSKDSDIDLVCIAPRHVQLQDFFSSFFKLLKSQTDIKHLRAITDAFVPIIKLTLDGIQVDLLFSRLPLPTIPEDINIREESVLKKVDAKSLRSMEGIFVTEEILQLVPDQETFRTALRAVRLWARRKGVYSKIFGYCGGVSWGILVGHVCQLYPKATASELVYQFFRIYSEWDWPSPVSLQDKELGYPVWVQQSERVHLMPIITPVRPFQNTSFNVTESTRAIITEAFLEGLDVVKQINDRKEGWGQLFTHSDFFDKFENFVIVNVSAEEEGHYLEWRGYVQSKIRMLVGNFERNPLVQSSRILPTEFGPISLREGQYMCQWCIGLVFSVDQAEQRSQFALTKDIQRFSDLVNKQARTIKLFKVGMKLEIQENINQARLSEFLSEETLNKRKIRKEDGGLLSSDSAAFSPPTATSRPSSQDADVITTVVGAEESETSEKVKHSITTANGPSALHSESIQWNVPESSRGTAAAGIARGEAALCVKSEQVVSSPSRDSGKYGASKRPGSLLQIDTPTKKLKYLDQVDDESMSSSSTSQPTVPTVSSQNQQHQQLSESDAGTTVSIKEFVCEDLPDQTRP